jgi:hypothetical protein
MPYRTDIPGRPQTARFSGRTASVLATGGKETEQQDAGICPWRRDRRGDATVRAALVGTARTVKSS